MRKVCLTGNARVGDCILDYDMDFDTVAITSIRHVRQSDPEIEHDPDFDFEAAAEDPAVAKPNCEFIDNRPWAKLA